jgi:phospholipase C
MDNRRAFLKKTALLAGGMGFIPAAIQKALAINPDPGTTYLDAEHIVFLMQENRSFDHAFGTLKGVRGYRDPRAIQLPSGKPVWFQTNKKGETYCPFRLNIKDTKATWMNSLPHSWFNQTDARNDGKYDQWLDAKKGGFPDIPMTMGYYTREDIPFYYALADAFTVCDQHFCSSLTGTTPNRLYFWTGTIRPEPHMNAPAAVRNDQVDYGREASWTTFPERLEDAGISWKVYQNELSLDSGLEEEHDAWLTNFTDNPLEWFKQFNVPFASTHQAYVKSVLPGLEEASDPKESGRLASYRKSITEYTPQAWEDLSSRSKNLHRGAFTTNASDPDYRSLTSLTYHDQGVERSAEVPKGDVLYQFRKDVDQGNLPTVSWLVAPEHYSDHPGSAWYGSWYVSEVLDILTRNPEVWKKTIFVLTYDENDGCFDHVPPFVVPHPLRDDTGKLSPGLDAGPEFVPLDLDKTQTKQEKETREGPIGLGYRVPLVVASPWSRGGWVNSEVFDHTSSLQFLETFLNTKYKRSIKETNISAWRRNICGDLTSIFRPYHGEPITQPAFLDKDTVLKSILQAQYRDLPLGFSASFTPAQELGTKPSNALAYELYASGSVSNGAFHLSLSAANKQFGPHSLGAPFHVYAPGNYLQVLQGPQGDFQGQPVMAPVKTWSYACTPGDTLNDSYPLSSFEGGHYHLRVYGPNGFFREFKGSAADPQVKLSAIYNADGSISLSFTGTGTKQPVQVIDHAYAKNTKQFTLFEDLGTHAPSPFVLDLETASGWYDFSIKFPGYEAFEVRYAGRVETGKDSITDPFMGGVV